MEQAEPAPSRREQDGRASLERDREAAVRHRDDALEASIVDQHLRAAHQEGRVARAETRLARLEQDERERRAWQSRLDEACGRQAAAIGEQRRREAEQQRDAVRTLPDAELRAEIDSARGALWEPQPEERERVSSREVELRKVEKELATRSHDCEQVAQEVARDRQALESRSPLARLRRGERATLRFALPWGERRLAEEHEKVRDLEARRERLQKDAADQGAWQQRQKLARDRAEAVRAELSARQPGAGRVDLGAAGACDPGPRRTARGTLGACLLAAGGLSPPGLRRAP